MRCCRRSGPKGYLFFLLLIFLLPSSQAIASDQKSLTLEIHPYLPATKLVNRFSPLTRYLSQKIGMPVILRIAPNYKEHIENIGRDEIDIAYMGPASYVKLVDTYGKKPLLARLEIDGRPTFYGVIFTVSGNSTIRSLTDLHGKSFAFGNPHSTMSHLIPRYMLWKAGVGIDQLSGSMFHTNHEDVVLSVLMGKHDAGAVKEEVFYKYKRRGLKAISWTPPISEHLFIASNKLPIEIVSTLRNAFYQLKDDMKGHIIMSAIKKGITGMVPVKDEDYDNLRTIIKTLKDLGVEP